MIVEYQLPGDMTVSLERADVHAFMSEGFTVERKGLIFPDSKTWVRLPRIARSSEPVAQIDASHDIYVDLPNGLEDLPARIESADIVPYMTQDMGQVIHFFGESGAIIVKIAENEP